MQGLEDRVAVVARPARGVGRGSWEPRGAAGARVRV